MKNRKFEVTENYLNNILQALKDAKGLCEVNGYKNEYSKYINTTKKYINRINNLIKS